MTASLTPLSPTLLAGHVSCAHLTQLERKRQVGELTVEFNADPRLEAMRIRGQQHEARYIERLHAQGREVCDLRGENDPAMTRDAMQRGCDVIVQAPLSNEVFFGYADVLLRVENRSALGDYSYEPVDTKLALDTKAGTILQLCTYCDMLASMQGARPDRFHVVTPLGNESYRLADFGAYYRVVRVRLGDAASAMPAPTTYPEPVAHCDVCNYWRFCDERRRSDDHPSLIANIRTAQAREFQRQGLVKVVEIAEADGKLPSEPFRGSADTYRRLGHQARLQVRARNGGRPPVDLLTPEDGRGLGRLPAPSPGDVFLDFEGDPFVGEHGLEYLTGFLARDRDGIASFEQRWALCLAEEKAACEAFIDFVAARAEDDPGTHVYHFGAYEPSALKRLCARHATRGEELDRLLRGRRFIDLHAVLREGLRIGVERYGLKEMESLHAFARTLDLRDAAIARRDLEIALELGESSSIAEELRERVAAYNRDDCFSTESLRNWFEQERAEAIAHGHDIRRPAAGDMAPTEAVSERDQRIEALRRTLRADLPDQAAQWSEEEHGRALLAAMLGYFRQEEKNAWWEHFRLRALPSDEQFDEREMLAGLQFEGVLPRQGKERTTRCRFTFPPQETAIDVGDGVIFTEADEPSPKNQTSATVAELDLEARSVVLKIGQAAGDRRPRAVFRDQVVSAKALEQALLRFAEHVRDHGFAADGTFRAARELLLRRQPRRDVACGVPLRYAEESVLAALKRICAELDHGVLPVQGPPGAGKTYSGAKAILELTRAGRTVGITACSHKVIDNLLTAVRDAAKEEVTPVRLVHKHDGDAPDGVEYVGSDALAAVAPGTVVGGTAWLWASEDAVERLDFLFIDEAGQMALAMAVAAAGSTRNLVLLGDPQQLEQPSKGAHPEGADVAALVHVLGKDRSTLGPEQGLFLDATYRLHPAICEFTSELYYDNRLHPAAGLERQEIHSATQFSGAGLFLVEVSHEGNQAQAKEEVEAVFDIAQSLIASTTWIDSSGRARLLRADDILVVAPYNAQVAALQRRLAVLDIDRVGTVDRFQGQEAAVVIYSCTSSSPEDAPRGMSFLFNPHRFNVATSRARCAVIVVASPKLFEPECRTPEQMRWVNGICRYREMATLCSVNRI